MQLQIFFGVSFCTFFRTNVCTTFCTTFAQLFGGGVSPLFLNSCSTFSQLFAQLLLSFFSALSPYQRLMQYLHTLPPSASSLPHGSTSSSSQRRSSSRGSRQRAGAVISPRNARSPAITSCRAWNARGRMGPPGLRRPG